MTIFDIILNIFEVLPKDIANMNQATLIQAPLITAVFYFLSRWFRAYILRLGLFIFGALILLQVFQGQSFLFRFDFYAGLGILLPHLEVVEITYLIIKEKTLFSYEKIQEFVLLIASPFLWLYRIIVELADYIKSKQEEKTNRKAYKQYYNDDFKKQQKAEWEKEQARQDEQSQREFREQEAKKQQQKQEQQKRYEEEKKQYQQNKQSEKKKPSSRWESTNPYEVLGIEETATKNEIKKAYRKLAKIYHPDLALVNKKKAEEIFKMINRAYEDLS